MRQRTDHLARDNRGNVAVEFAILAPTLIALMLGVFQIGMAMQSYNALRSIAMDTVRYSTVQYQTSHTFDDAQIATWARGRAINAPYLLDESGIVATVVTPGTQRVAGAQERTLTLRYTVPTFLSVIGIRSYYISYTRTIFVPR